MAQFQIDFTVTNSKQVEKAFQILAQEAKKAESQLEDLGEALSDSSDELKAVSTASDKAGDGVEGFADSVDSAEKEVAKLANSLKNTVSNIDDIAQTAGQGNLALERLSNSLGLSNKETLKTVKASIELEEQLRKIASTSDKTDAELRQLIKEFEDGSDATKEFANRLETTEEFAEQFALEVSQSEDTLAAVAKQLNITQDEVLEFANRINKGQDSLGKLIDELQASDIAYDSFIENLSHSNATLAQVATVTGKTEEELQQLVRAIALGDNAVAELSAEMGINEAEARSLLKAYADSRTELNLSTKSTDNLADSLTKVKKSTSELPGTFNASAQAISKAEKETADLSFGMTKATAETRKLGDQTDKTSQIVSDGLDAIGQIAGIIVAEIAAVGYATNQVTEKFVEFDQAIRQSAVVSGEASVSGIGALTEKVRELGLETSKTPAEIAKLSVSFSRAGFSINEQVNALEGVIRASEATGESLEDMGGIIAQVIRTFSLSASESERVADILVSAANNTNTSVVELGEGFAQVGAVAVQTNQPVEDIAIALGLLADQGLEASIGGTLLSEGLRRLSLASAGANTEFTDLIRGQAKLTGAFTTLGADIRDANGQLLPLTDLLPILKQRFSELSSQEDKDIVANALFGVQGGRAFLGLLNQTTERINEVSTAVERSGGVAQRSGEQMLEGLGGAMTLLSSSFDTLLIDIGQFLSVGIEPVVRAATDLLNSFLELPPSLKNLVFGFGSLTIAAAAAAVAIGAYIKLQIGAKIASIAATVELLKAAAATGLLTKLFTVLKIALLDTLIALAPIAAALAAISASAAFVADTFKRVTSESDKTQDSIKNIDNALRSYNEASGITSANNAEAAKNTSLLGKAFQAAGDFGEAFINATVTGLNIVIDAIAKAARKLFSIYDALPGIPDAVKKAFEEAVLALEGFDLSTTFEAEQSRIDYAFDQLVNKAGEVEQSFIKLKENGIAGNIEGARQLRDAITLVIEELGKQTKLNSEDAAQRDALVAKYKDQVSQLNAVILGYDQSAQSAIVAAGANKELTNSYDELQSALDRTIGKIEADLIKAQVNAYDEFGNNKEALENRLEQLEGESLKRRLEAQVKFLDDVNNNTFESAEEKAQAVQDAEEAIANTQIEIAQDVLKFREEAEQEFREKQEALAKRAYEQEKLLLEQQTRDRQSAIDTQIAAQEAAIESINDQTEALNQQLTLTQLLGEETQLIYDRRLQDIDAEIASLQNVEGSQERIVQLEEKRRQIVLEKLVSQQKQERQQLDFQLQIERLELDRQVRQATINELAARKAVIDAEQLAISQQIQLTEQNRLINQAKINEASQAELTNLEAQKDAIVAQLNLSAEGIALAQQSAELAAGEVEDAYRLRDGYEEIAAKQTNNLAIQQQNAREQLAQTQEAERTAGALESAADAAGNVKDASSGAADEAARLADNAAKVASNYSSAADALQRLQGIQDKASQYESARAATKDFSPLKTVRTSGGQNARTQYFIGDKEVSLQDYNKEIESRKQIRDLAGRTVGGSLSGFVAGEGSSVEEIEASIRSIENLKKNTEALIRRVPGAGGYVDKKSEEILARLNDLLIKASTQAVAQNAIASQISPRFAGGPVSPGSLYTVNEAGMEAFKPSGSNNLIPLLQPPNSLFSPSVPGTIIPALQTANALNVSGLLSEIQGLRKDLASRPVPTLNAPATFINEPSPLQTQINWLQHQMRSMRGI